MSRPPRGPLLPAEVVVLEALGKPGTRWHSLVRLACVTGLRRDLDLVYATLRCLQLQGLATGPPEQPFAAWSITTQGAAALEAPTRSAAA